MFYMPVLSELCRFAHFHEKFIDNNQATSYNKHGYVFSFVDNEGGSTQPKPVFLQLYARSSAQRSGFLVFVSQEFELFYDERMPYVICTYFLPLHWNTSYVSE